RVQACLPVLQRLVAGEKDLGQFVAIFLLFFRRHRPALYRPRTAVNYESKPWILRTLELLDLTKSALLRERNGHRRDREHHHETHELSYFIPHPSSLILSDSP